MRAPTELLLVEDEPLIRDMLETVLTDAGFKVVVAYDGTRALASLNADPTRFRAVITDINLGRGPNGWEVGRHARKIVPAMPVVYMTGGNAHEWSANGIPDSILITKPFTLDHVVTVIATLLNNAETRSTQGSFQVPLAAMGYPVQTVASATAFPAADRRNRACLIPWAPGHVFLR